MTQANALRMKSRAIDHGFHAIVLDCAVLVFVPWILSAERSKDGTEHTGITIEVCKNWQELHSSLGY